MKLDRLRLLLNSINSASHLVSASKRRTFYYLFRKKWWSENQEQIDDGSIAQQLSRVLKNNTPWRPSNSKTAYFPIKNFECVVCIEFLRPPQTQSLKKHSEEIVKCIENSSNEFAAKYDPLTKLYKRERFEEIALEQIDSSLGNNTEVNAELDVKASESIALLSIDIDHFKQVNDSYGHAYGNVVISTVARRIELETQAIAEDADGSFRVYCSRPSGEEFQVLIVGAFSPRSEVTFSERIRNAVSTPPIPSDDEINELDKEGVGHAVTAPPLSDRNTTISIGIACVTPASLDMDARGIFSMLLHKSDTALYKAKGLGRKRSVHFDDISKRYGRIIAFHEETDIVTLDVGSKVGVTIGQEFLVFHPDFNGQKDFTISDGRTKKTVGKYPKLSNGRIELIDVQDEVSFAHILSKRTAKAFKIGSYVEPVPVGSIGHLVATRAQGNPSVSKFTSREEMDDVLQTLAEEGIPTVVVAFSLNDLVAFSDKRGIANANQVLAGLYEQLCEQIPTPSASFSLVENGVVIAYGPKADLFGSKTPSEELKKILDKIEKAKPTFPKISSGVFDLERWTSKSFSAHIGAPPKTGMELRGALIALEAAINSTDKVLDFTPFAVDDMLMKRVKKVNPDQAQDLYDELYDHGIETAAMNHFLAAVLFNHQSDLHKAINLWKRSISIEPKYAGWPFFCGVACYSYGDAVEAAKHFRDAESKGIAESLKDKYSEARIISYCEAREKGFASISKDEVRALLEPLVIDENKVANFTRAGRAKLSKYFVMYGLSEEND